MVVTHLKKRKYSLLYTNLAYGILKQVFSSHLGIHI